MSALFSFTPTFTQGLVLGQISIIGLLFIILKYLFLDSAEQPRSVDPPALKPPPPRSSLGNGNLEENLDDDSESAEWFNLLLQQ
ncbi:ERMES complex subunit mmm1, partial [Tulasnella sp. 418]